MSYDFCNKHKMHAVERKTNAMINKNKNLSKKLDRSKGHHLLENFLMFHLSLTSTCWDKKYQPLTIDMTKDKYTGRYGLGLNSLFVPNSSTSFIN